MEHDFHNDHVVLAPVNRAKKKRNAFAIVLIVLGSLSLVLYALMILGIIAATNFSYMDSMEGWDAFGALFLAMFQLGFAVGGGFMIVVALVIMQVVQLVMFILGFAVPRLPRKPMIAGGIIFFITTVACIAGIVLLLAMLANSGINIG